MGVIKCNSHTLFFLFERQNHNREKRRQRQGDLSPAGSLPKGPCRKNVAVPGTEPGASSRSPAWVQESKDSGHASGEMDHKWSSQNSGRCPHGMLAPQPKTLCLVKALKYNCVAIKWWNGYKSVHKIWTTEIHPSVSTLYTCSQVDIRGQHSSIVR